MLALILTLSCAAPVPKERQKEEPKLANVAGTWHYEWRGSLNGWIVLNKDGTYEAKHDPNGTTLYVGTYTLDKNTLTLAEYAVTDDNREPAGGEPTFYRFEFDLKDWPKEAKGTTSGGFSFDAAVPKQDGHCLLRRQP